MSPHFYKSRNAEQKETKEKERGNVEIVNRTTSERNGELKDHALSEQERQNEARKESELLDRLLCVMNPSAQISEDIHSFPSSVINDSEERQKRDQELMSTLAEIRKHTTSK